MKRQAWLVLFVLLVIGLLMLVASELEAQTVRADRFTFNSGPCVMRSGSGSPEGVVTGNVCDQWHRTDSPYLVYIKRSGSGNTGWLLLASTDLTDSANLPRLNALTNAFVSAVTTQAGGISVAGAGVTTGQVVKITGSTASPGMDGGGSGSAAVLSLTGNLGSSGSGNPPSTSLLLSAATINATAAFAANANAFFNTSVQNTTNAGVSWGVYSRVDDNTALGNTLFGVDSHVVSTANANKTIYGISGDVAAQSNTANTVYGLNFGATQNGVVTTGTQNTFGLNVSAVSTSINGGTANVYGGRFQGGGSVTSGTLNSYGLYVANASSMNTTGTTKNIGLYVEAPTGADTNYGAIFAGGNVGVGTVTPTAKLSIQDDTTGGASAYIQNINTGTAALSTLAAYNNLADGAVLYSYSSNYSGTLYGVNRARLSELRLDGTTGGMVDTGASGGPLYFGTGAATPSLTILDAGNVGIGTVAPTTKLHVYSTTAFDGIRLDGTNKPALYFTASGVTKAMYGVSTAASSFINGDASGDLSHRVEGGNILFSTDSGTTAQMYLKNGGNVGIGDLTPGAKLEVNDTSATQYAARIFQDNATDSFGLQVDAGIDANDYAVRVRSRALADRFVVRGDGNVGIGTTGPNDLLDVKGIVRITGTAGAPNYARFDNTANAAKIWRFGATGATTQSDFNIYNETDGVTAITMVPTGHVGIGVAPTRRFHVLASTQNQFIAAQTTPPTCSASCGTSPSVTGSDTFMTVTMGATGTPASGFVITFSGTWPAAPSCVGAMATAGMVVGKLPLTIVTTATTMTVVTNGTAPGTGNKYHFHCGGPTG